MSTKKDLVEAYSFSRRRLVTAFLSGAPGGREVEPTKPSRGIVGGIALAVLLCAGAAIAGFLGGRPNSNWLDEGSFVISKDTGEQYVVLRGGDDPSIQRVPNFVSAQLLLGSAEPSVFSVKDKYIRKVRLGGDLGIEGAPAGLPATAELIESGWTACTEDGNGIKLNVAETPEVEPATTGAFAVTTAEGGMWLIAASPEGKAYRFAMPADQIAQSNVLDALGFGASTLAPVVEDDWLNLFRPGPELSVEAFGVTRDDQPVDYSEVDTDLSAYAIGDLLQTDRGYYLLADDAPQRLDDFAALLYQSLGAAPQQLPTNLSARQEAPVTPAQWPAEVPAGVQGGEMCGVLVDDGEGGTSVALGVEPTEDASAAELSAESHDVDVDPSGGAYVLSGGDGVTTGGKGDGSPYVVDAKGAKYSLIGPSVADFIGYGGFDPPVVPDAWLEFFDTGVELSVNSARRLPENAADAASS
ncbi:MAG: type VII secretion protein EccB [Nocardioides sp.]|nr:type VII secretion protein EccB [Nocardioides sp.]